MRGRRSLNAGGYSGASKVALFAAARGRSAQIMGAARAAKVAGRGH